MLPSQEQAPWFPSPILSSSDVLSPWAPSGLDYLSVEAACVPVGEPLRQVLAW